MDVSAAAVIPPSFETGANIIGGIFGVIGIYEFIKGLIPTPPKGVTNVGVAVGQTADNPDKDDAYNMEGNIPAISVYSVAGNLVGSSKGDKKKTWKAGSKNAVSLENNAGQNSVGSEYISVVATGTNAICISAVGLKNPNDEASYGWFSDVGVSCGMQFHWSETIVGNLGTQGYRPNCVWITGPNSKNDINTQGFSMHIIDFSKVTEAQAQAYNDNYDLMCGSAPRFSAWTTMLPDISPPVFLPSLQYGPEGTDLDISKVFVPGVDKQTTDILASTRPASQSIQSACQHQKIQSFLLIIRRSEMRRRNLLFVQNPSIIHSSPAGTQSIQQSISATVPTPGDQTLFQRRRDCSAIWIRSSFGHCVRRNRKSLVSIPR